MAQKNLKLKFFIIILLFLVYFLVAARPIPRETVLSAGWISSLANSFQDDLFDALTEYEPVPYSWSGELLPFMLGPRFGFIDSSGGYALNRAKTQDVYLSGNMWTEHAAEPVNITVNNILNGNEITVENAGGYPVLLDDRIFILGSDQNSLSEIDNSGNVRWTYEFGAPLTAIDAASGLVVTGSLDGLIEVFNSSGRRIYYFEPTGSRYSIILGAAISRNGTYIGVISGIEQQRFMLFERLGSEGDYRVIYHEYLDSGFRRPVHIVFVDDDQRVIYERMDGIGCFNIRTRRVVNIPLDGEIAAIDESGADGYLFLVTSHANQMKKLVGIKFPAPGIAGISTAAPETVFLKASFKSDDVFLKRTGSMFVIGGGTALISFDLEEK